MDNQSDKNIESAKIDIRLGEDRILYIYLAGRFGAAETKKFIEEKIKVLKGIEGKVRTFCDANNVKGDLSTSMKMKDLIIKDLKEIEKDKVEKMAIVDKRKVMKILGLYIGRLLGVKETKIFNNKEDALKWLKN